VIEKLIECYLARRDSDAERFIDVVHASASNLSRNPYMATLIKERRIVADSWHLLERGSKGELPEVPARGDVIVPLALWLARREDFLAYPGKLGVWIDANEGRKRSPATCNAFRSSP